MKAQKPPRILTGMFTYNCPDMKLDNAVRAILEALNGNGFFPQNEEVYVNLKAFAPIYSASVAKAANGSRTDVAIKNANKAILISRIIVVADWVTLIAQGDLAILTSTGFPLSKEKEPKPPMTKPEIMKIIDGLNNGELMVYVNRLQSALIYTYEYTVDPITEASVWIGQNCSSSKCLLKGLPSGSRVWIRVMATGTKGQVTYSDPVLSRLIQ